MPSSELQAHLARLEALSAELEPSSTERVAWQEATNQVINEFIQGLDGMRTFSPRTASTLPEFESRVADAAKSLPQLVGVVKDGIQGAGLLTAGPGHLGFIPGGGLYIGALADHLAAALNPFSADGFAAPVAAAMHTEVIRWLCRIVGYDEASAYGDICSGGTHATLAALQVARKVHGLKARDFHRVCIYFGEHTHHCAHKALSVLFSDEIIIRQVPSVQHRLDPEVLAAMIAADQAAGLIPWVIIATAGTTNLGLIDPIAALAKIAAEHKLWLHVDAAYGGFFNMCAAKKAAFAGFETADSIVLDPHKGMFLPYGSGAVLIKEGHLLRKVVTGTYLQDRDGEAAALRSPMDYSLELTRPFRSLRLWLTLKVYGSEPIAAALSAKLLLAELCFAELEKIPHLELVAPSDLSIISFRFRAPTTSAANDELTKRLLGSINSHPEVFLSSTVINEQFVIRIAILSFRTKLHTIERLLAIIASEAQALLVESINIT